MNDANMLVLNSTITKYANLLTDIDVAKHVGFDAMEIHTYKLDRYLEAGYSELDLGVALSDVAVIAAGHVADVERQGRAREELFREAERIFSLAKTVGARGVQILSGPIDVQAVIDYAGGKRGGMYSDLLGLSTRELIHLAANNIRVLADMANELDLLLYLEPLSWSPINGLQNALQLIDATGRDNVKLVIDYWHCFTSGVRPDDVAKLDKSLIFGVHVCDSLPYDGGIPIETAMRDVPTGQGVLNLKDWTEAVKATGYRGWWAAETFSRKMQQQPVNAVARDMRHLLGTLVGA
jgi:sugar phosphate isomerase/epimerase